VIKDDHGIANQQCHPFEQRVTAVQKAINEANRETGGNTVYAPTFSGGGLSLREQARVANEHGVRMALVAPMLVGIPAFVEMQVDLAIPVMAHPAFAGAARIAPPALLGMLLPAFRRRRHDLSESRWALRLQPRHLHGDRARGARAVGGRASHASRARGRHDGRARGRDGVGLRGGHDAAHRRRPAHAREKLFDKAREFVRKVAAHRPL
jgi:hypothetical protein